MYEIDSLMDFCEETSGKLIVCMMAKDPNFEALHEECFKDICRVLSLRLEANTKLPWIAGTPKCSLGDVVVAALLSCYYMNEASTMPECQAKCMAMVADKMPKVKTYIDLLKETFKEHCESRPPRPM